jgi:hypothetical protein
LNCSVSGTNQTGLNCDSDYSSHCLLALIDIPEREMAYLGRALGRMHLLRLRIRGGKTG